MQSMAFRFFIAALVMLAGPAYAGPSALYGTVRSLKDGPMEGVVVIAQRQGSAVLTAVSSDAAGRFAFPRDHLRPGDYTLTVRAVGYELSSPSASTPVRVNGKSLPSLGLTLRPVTDPSKVASQMTNFEWLDSFPGTTQQKDALIRNVVNCGFCHSLDRIARSNHSAEELTAVIQRMATYESDHSSGTRFQVSALPAPIDGLEWWGRDAKAMAEYLATVNLSQGRSTWEYPLKLLPRPRGRSTRAIVTVFPLPRQPSIVHDLDVDAHGNVWYGNTAWDFIGRLNPRTGQFSEWPAPNYNGAAAPKLDRVAGVMDIQVDPENHVWAAVGGTKLAVFAPETASWKTFDVPVVWLNPFRSPVRKGQHTLWVTGLVSPPTDGSWHEDAFSLDTVTGRLSAGIPLYNDKPLPKDPDHTRPFHYCYMMDQDAQGNFLCTDPVGSSIVRAASSDGRARLVPTPTPLAYPRRGYRDDQNRFWFTEFYADKIGVIDLSTDQVKEYEAGPKYISPYYARPDERGHVWVSSNGSDRLLRLDIATGEITPYLMPVYYDARKVAFDRSARLTTIWLANKNLGQLIRVEVPD